MSLPGERSIKARHLTLPESNTVEQHAIVIAGNPTEERMFPRRALLPVSPYRRKP